MIIRVVTAEVQNGELKVMMNYEWIVHDTLSFMLCLFCADFDHEWLQHRYLHNVQFFPPFFVPKTKF